MIDKLKRHLDVDKIFISDNFYSNSRRVSTKKRTTADLRVYICTLDLKSDDFSPDQTRTGVTTPTHTPTRCLVFRQGPVCLSSYTSSVGIIKEDELIHMSRIFHV